MQSLNEAAAASRFSAHVLTGSKGSATDGSSSRCLPGHELRTAERSLTAGCGELSQARSAVCARCPEDRSLRPRSCTLRGCESFDFDCFRHESYQRLSLPENCENRIVSQALRERAAQLVRRSMDCRRGTDQNHRSSQPMSMLAGLSAKGGLPPPAGEWPPARAKGSERAKIATIAILIARWGASVCQPGLRMQSAVWICSRAHGSAPIAALAHRGHQIGVAAVRDSLVRGTVHAARGRACREPPQLWAISAPEFGPALTLGEDHHLRGSGPMTHCSGTV